MIALESLVFLEESEMLVYIPNSFIYNKFFIKLIVELMKKYNVVWDPRTEILMKGKRQCRKVDLTSDQPFSTRVLSNDSIPPVVARSSLTHFQSLR